MSDEKIEQKVTVSDQARTGDITLIGKIVYTIKNPAEWQDAIWHFLSIHKGFIVIWLILEVSLTLTYLRFKNLYLMPFQIWALAAILLLAAAWGWYSFGWVERARLRQALALLSSLAFIDVIGWQTWRVVFPERFDPQVFGIAVAELGAGPDFRSTIRSREISGQVYEHLCQAIGSEFATVTNDGPCRNVGESAERGPVEVKRIGIVPDAQTAREYGRKIRADVVIWGQMLSSNGGGVTIRFQVLETLDKAVNPEFPLILPVTNKLTEVFVKEIDLEGNPAKVKEIVSQQLTIISAFTLGLASYLDRNVPQSVLEFEKAAAAIEQNPTLEVPPAGKSLLYFYLGRSDNALGRLKDGQDWLKRAKETNAEEPAIPLSLALGYGSLGQEQQRDENLNLSLELIYRWLQTHPDDITAIYNRGVIHEILKQQSEAIFDFESVLKLDPDFYIAYLSLGQAATEVGKFEQAEESLRNAIALAERSGANPAWAHLNIALTYDKAGHPDLAKIEFQKAIASAPKVDWMYYYYARFLERQQETETALSTYKDMVEVTWDKGWAYGILAGFLKTRHMFKEARENYLNALSAKPNDVLLHTYLAETYFALGNFESAKKEFEESISLSENIYYPYASYGGFLFQVGEFERAEEMFQHSLKLRPDDYKTLFNLGRTYENLAQSERAKQIYREILNKNDQVPEIVKSAARDRLQQLESAEP